MQWQSPTIDLCWSHCREGSETRSECSDSLWRRKRLAPPVRRHVQYRFASTSGCSVFPLYPPSLMPDYSLLQCTDPGREIETATLGHHRLMQGLRMQDHACQLQLANATWGNSSMPSSSPGEFFSIAGEVLIVSQLRQQQSNISHITAPS